MEEEEHKEDYQPKSSPFKKEFFILVAIINEVMKKLHARLRKKKGIPLPHDLLMELSKYIQNFYAKVLIDFEGIGLFYKKSLKKYNDGEAYLQLLEWMGRVEW